MKTPFLVFLCALLLCNAVGYAQPERKSSSSVPPLPVAAALSPADIAAIRAASAKSSEFGNRKDWSNWSRTYTDDAVVMPPNGPAVSGRAEIEKWGRTFPPHREFRVEPIEIEGRGDLAMVRGRYSFILMLPGQPEQLDSGKYIEIWRRQPDGAWKIWRDILNSDLPAAPAIATSAQDVVAAVKAAAERHLAAINSRDSQTVRNQHTRDYTIFPAEADARLAFPAVLSPVAMAMAKRWEGSKPNWTIRDLHIQPYGNVAVATFYQDGKIAWTDGTVDSRPRRVTEVWVNENGTWKEAHHHDSVYTTPERTGGAR